MAKDRVRQLQTTVARALVVLVTSLLAFKLLLFSPTLKHPPRTLLQVHEHVTRAWKTVETWVTEEEYRGTLHRYGLDAEGRDFAALGDTVASGQATVADLLVFYGERLPKLEYLELGVGVGKTFFAMADALRHRSDAILYGLDVEEPPRGLSRLFGPPVTLSKWMAKASVALVRKCRMFEYRLARRVAGENRSPLRVRYLLADALLPGAWSQMRSVIARFNLIHVNMRLADKGDLVKLLHTMRREELLAHEFVLVARLSDDQESAEGFDRFCTEVRAQLPHHEAHPIECKMVRLQSVFGPSRPASAFGILGPHQFVPHEIDTLLPEHTGGETVVELSEDDLAELAADAPAVIEPAASPIPAVPATAVGGP